MPDLHRTALFRHVADDYRHYSKQAKPVRPLVAPNVYLKWYLLAVPDRLHSELEISHAQSFILEEITRGRLKLSDEIGFVVQHRISNADIFYVCSWNGNNELWETHYIRALGSDEYEVGRHGTKFPTYCVWVLAIVQHETSAWSRYLLSTRDELARRAYCVDQLDAPVQ